AGPGGRGAPQRRGPRPGGGPSPRRPGRGRPGRRPAAGRPAHRAPRLPPAARRPAGGGRGRPGGGPPGPPRALRGPGPGRFRGARFTEAASVWEEAIAVAREVGAPVVEGHAMNSLGTAVARL